MVLGDGLELVRNENGLALVGDGMVLRADFARMLPRLRPDRLRRELLVRAARVHDAGEAPLAIDATAGLGEDSLLLAAAGFTVRMYEHNPVVAALVADALVRAAATDGLAGIVSRMTLVEGDSIAGLVELGERPCVVLLDPMFPERTKTAAVRKKAQLLQRLEPPCGDEAALLDAAFAAGPRKVVVKRSLKGPNLAGRAPTYVLSGKAVRFDVYA